MKKSKLSHLGNCLVTGGTGYIGSRLIRHLVNNNVQVRALSRKKIQGVDTILCDFEKEEIPSNALDSIDTIFHLAGFSKDIGESRELENLYKKINVTTTTNLAELAMTAKVRNFLYISSVKAAGKVNVKQSCSTEKDVGELVGVYAKSKRAAEVKLLNLVKNSDMYLSILRPSMVYGPNVGGNIGSMQSGIKKGWFPPLPEMRNRKSMVHVDDVIRALVFLVGNNCSNGEVFNITDGQVYTSREVYLIIRKHLGKPDISWSVPKFIFSIASLFNLFLKNKLNKFLSDECYSSKKLFAIGFTPKKQLEDIGRSFIKVVK